MGHPERWLLIAALSVSLVEVPAAAEMPEAGLPPPEPKWEQGQMPSEALALLSADPPIVESAPAQAGATPSPAPAEPPPPPPPTAAEPEPKPDPIFDDWGAPGSDDVRVEPKIQAAIMLGVGASFDDTPASVNPLGFGFGLRGSYRFLPDYPELAVGGRFLYYVGGSGPLPNGEIAMSSWILAADAAYVFPVAGILLEPSLALGLSGRAIEANTPVVDVGSGFVPGGDTRTEVGFYVAPGASVCVPLSLMSPSLEQFFIGADVRLGMVLGHGVSGSFELMVQGGVRF
jgi:hypothetical protein